MMRFAYFGRPRGRVTTQKFIVDMLEDGKDWLRRSKLPRKDFIRGTQDRSLRHEAMHQLIDPLRQPSADQIQRYIESYGTLSKEGERAIRRQAYYQLQRSPTDANIYNANMRTEYKVAGLEGRKPRKNSTATARFITQQPEYWQARRVRKKAFTTQQMAASNLMDLAYVAKKDPQLIKPEDLSLIDKSYQGLTSNQENSYLLRTYGKYLRR